jgi:hypothetical protein
MNGGEVGDERERMEGFEPYVDTLRNVVIHCLDDAQDRRERDGAQGNQALEGVSRATVITFAFFVEQPTKTGQRRCSVCQPSVVIKSGSESLTSISERDQLGLKGTHNWRDYDAMLVVVKHATWLGYPFIRICIPVHGTTVHGRGGHAMCVLYMTGGCDARPLGCCMWVCGGSGSWPFHALELTTYQLSNERGIQLM